MNFRINLIKNEVLSFKRRRAIFWKLTAYLSLYVVIFIYLSFTMSANFGEICAYRDKIISLEKELYKPLAGIKNIRDYTDQMNIKMALHIKKLKTLDAILSKQINLSRLLDGILAPLPLSAHLNNFNFDQGIKVLNFDIVIPVEEASGFNTTEFITNWNRNAYLMANIKQIKSSLSQESERQGQKIIISRFRCILSESFTDD